MKSLFCAQTPLSALNCQSSQRPWCDGCISPSKDRKRERRWSPIKKWKKAKQTYKEREGIHKKTETGGLSDWQIRDCKNSDGKSIDLQLRFYVALVESGIVHKGWKAFFISELWWWGRRSEDYVCCQSAGATFAFNLKYSHNGFVSECWKTHSVRWMHSGKQLWSEHC